MLTCPKCHAGVPEGMRFCLQCGAPLASPPPLATSPSGADPKMPAAAGAHLAPHVTPVPPARVTARPQTPRKTIPTVPLKTAPTALRPPHAGTAAEYARPSLGDLAAEVDDEVLKKSFERPLTHPGAVLCRFCKVPLDIAADFCTHCGAPVAEAAPPGALEPKAQPAASTALVDDNPLSPPDQPAPGAPSVDSPAGSATGDHLGATPPPAAMPAADSEPTNPASPPDASPTPLAGEHASGLMGRLKRLFRKG
jgi:hypothetical protein